MRVRTSFFTAVLCTLSAGCLTPIDPASVPVGAVRVTLGDRAAALDTIAVRRTVRVNAVAVAREGYELPLATFRFASSNPGVAQVDSLGMVLGIAPGTATITAAAPDGTQGAATVVVVPSTVDYSIDVGGVPGDIAFSPDYTKAYVAVSGGSVAFLDALGFLRTSILPLGNDIGGLAATASLLYVTHPAANAVSIITTATHDLAARIAVAGSPSAVVARGTRAWVAERTGAAIAVFDGSAATTSFSVRGEPSQLALSEDGERLYVSVHDSGTWRLALFDATSDVEQGSVTIPGEPIALSVAAGADGTDHVYAVIPSTQTMLELSVTRGQPSIERSAVVPSMSGGVAARGGTNPLVVVSGSPLGMYDGATLGLVDTVAGGGTGHVAIRPDGLFVFVGDGSSGVVRVIGL
jgi:DNA-binding beta-propeller fold protein YncE